MLQMIIITNCWIGVHSTTHSSDSIDSSATQSHHQSNHNECGTECGCREMSPEWSECWPNGPEFLFTLDDIQFYVGHVELALDPPLLYMYSISESSWAWVNAAYSSNDDVEESIEKMVVYNVSDVDARHEIKSTPCY